jgi:hypothetical protein
MLSVAKSLPSVELIEQKDYNLFLLQAVIQERKFPNSVKLNN